MPRIVGPPECADKPGSVYSNILNDVIRKKVRELIPEGEQNWYAEYVFHLPSPTFSAYLNGTRAFPAWLVVAIDKAFKSRSLLSILEDAEAAGPSIDRPVDPRTLKTLFSLALKEEGAFNSRLVDAISDDVVDAAEADDLDRGISKIQQFLSAMRERLAEAKETEKAHGRPA